MSEEKPHKASAFAFIAWGGKWESMSDKQRQIARNNLAAILAAPDEPLDPHEELREAAREFVEQYKRENPIGWQADYVLTLKAKALEALLAKEPK